MDSFGGRIRRGYKNALDPVCCSWGARQWSKHGFADQPLKETVLSENVKFGSAPRGTAMLARGELNPVNLRRR
jgi:hypothetical protein